MSESRKSGDIVNVASTSGMKGNSIRDLPPEIIGTTS